MKCRRVRRHRATVRSSRNDVVLMCVGYQPDDFFDLCSSRGKPADGYDACSSRARKAREKQQTRVDTRETANARNATCIVHVMRVPIGMSPRGYACRGAPTNYERESSGLAPVTLADEPPRIRQEQNKIIHASKSAPTLRAMCIPCRRVPSPLRTASS
eukprot:5183147-Pleurochrysis_carterae.AAC.3